jgi:hypothetical protein
LFDEPAITDEDTALEDGGLAWLESLAADQSSGFPQMDLAALSAELEDLSPEPEPEPDAEAINPMNWLESLAEGDPEVTEAQPEALADFLSTGDDDIDLGAIADPLAAGIDPMLWLESLAKRQGVRAEELTTSADMDIPIPDDVVDTGPGYEAFSVESEPRDSRPAARAQETLDPAAWLESMAAGSAALDEPEGDMSDEDIQKALAAGEDIPPDEMEKFFSRQLDRGLTIDEPEEHEEYDPDAPPLPAELPDWLLEQVQMPDDSVEGFTVDQAPALVEDILEPPAQDLPDWLKVGDDQETDLQLENIFESAEETTSAEAEAFYSTDPWVQAFSEEAAADPDEIPEWYERNLRDPKRIAAVEQEAGGQIELEEAALPPEENLPQGEPVAVPVWLSDEEEIVPEVPDWLSEVAVTDSDSVIPDWLAAADVEVAPEEIPDWLRETVETEEALDDLFTSPQETASEPVIHAPQPAAPVAIPAPTPAPVPAGDIAAALEQARTKATSGDLNGSLVAYESVIRANAALDQAVSDLTRLADYYKENPAVYRVLGDGLMRQGKLQAALDTYRKALNQL